MNATTITVKATAPTARKILLQHASTVMWFLARPRLYPQLVRKICGRLTGSRNLHRHTKQEAEAWCAEVAVSPDEALRLLFGDDSAPKLSELHTDTLKRAEQRQRDCPVEMGGPADLDLLYGVCEKLNAKAVIETGVAYGWSTLAALLSLSSRDGSLLVSTDRPYPGRGNDDYVGWVVPDELRENWTLLRYADREGLPKALELLPTIDLAHYDSDKTYSGRIWASNLLWKHLRPGGIFMSDDIGDNIGYKHFVESLGIETIIVPSGEKYIGFLRKPE